jgi:hypothetical protein
MNRRRAGPAAHGRRNGLADSPLRARGFSFWNGLPGTVRASDFRLQISGFRF